MGLAATGHIVVTADGYRQNVVDLADAQIAQHPLLFGDIKQRAVVQHFALFEYDQPVGQLQDLSQRLAGV